MRRLHYCSKIITSVHTHTTGCDIVKLSILKQNATIQYTVQPIALARDNNEELGE